MKKDEVPQDNISTYAGHQKLFYAVENDGEYTGVQSTGWDVEGEATQDAINVINADRQAAWQRGRDGISAPLEFHMFNCRMDLALLSQATGFFQWRIRRHFKPDSFKKLSQKNIDKYCDALGLSKEDLNTLPDEFSAS
ncbi:MAG: hypothetical protein K6L75_00275 [Cellvibrionaceae bacterium]